MKTSFVAALAFSAAALFLTCTTLDPLAGTSVNSGNARITGKIVYPVTGAPISGGMVRLRSATFVRGVSVEPHSHYRNVHTQSDGTFEIDSVARGEYCIEANDYENDAAHATSKAVLRRVTIAASDTLMTLPTDTLQPVATIVGTIASFAEGAQPVAFRLYGLDRAARVDSGTKTFMVNDIPLGTYTLCITAGPAVIRPVAARGIVATAGDTIDIGRIDGDALARWKGSRRLVLSTTPAGANIAATITRFPVLVRLNAANFPFTDALPDGADLRFTKSDSTPLPLEIESWDAAQKLAAVWVRVDTIYGNNDSQSITMRWGNHTAGPVSNSAMVFDTGRGFQGVWHLAGRKTDFEYDATNNRYNGTCSDTAPLPTAGQIGGARLFNGSSNFLQMKGTASSKLNFLLSSDYEISAWVKVASLNGKQQMIVSKDDHLQYHLQIRHDLWELANYDPAIFKWEIVTTPAVAQSWKYVVAVRTGGASRLYVDGFCLDSTDSLVPNLNSEPLDTSFDVTVGRIAQNIATNPPYFYFGGTIDEVRMSNVTRSPYWIKLCYMNQKEQDALVKFR